MKEKTINIIGKSNTGKTKNILFNEVDNEINLGNDLFILDQKKEYINNFGNKLKENGYEISIINLKEPSRSDGWDPLEYISYLYENNKIDKCIELIKKMGLSLFKEKKNIDPFWENSATDYFTGIVLILLKIASKTENTPGLNTFTSIYNIINQGEKSYKNSTTLKTYCESLDPMDPIYISLSPIIYAPNETKGSIISIVKQKLNTFFMRPELLKSFYNNNFKISKLIEKENTKKAIFVIGYNPLNTLTNIIIEYLYDILITNNQNMTFILDGFDDLPELLCIEDMINTGNEGNIKLYLAIKNEDKLSEKYKSYIFNNIEKEIRLNDKYNKQSNIDENLNNKIYSLPYLKENTPVYFDFEEYIKKNF